MTNLESLPLERLLLHLCVLARAHRRKGSLPRLCGERVLLRVIDTLLLIGFGLPSTNQAQGEYTRNHGTCLAKSVDTVFYSCMFAQTTHYNQHNTYALKSSHTLGARISFEEREDKQERNFQGNCGNREVWRERMIDNVGISAVKI